MKKATIRIDDALAERLLEEMGNLTAAATWMVEAYAAVRQHGIASLRKYFTIDELLMILEAENGLLFSPRMISGYISHIEDAMLIDRVHEKYGVDSELMIAKISSIGKAELVILHDWMNYYWYGKLKERPPMREYLEA